MKETYSIKLFIIFTVSNFLSYEETFEPISIEKCFVYKGGKIFDNFIDKSHNLCFSYNDYVEGKYLSVKIGKEPYKCGTEKHKKTCYMNFDSIRVCIIGLKELKEISNFNFTIFHKNYCNLIDRGKTIVIDKSDKRLSLQTYYLLFESIGDKTYFNFDIDCYGRLSKKEIIGVVLGCIAFVLILLFISFLMIKKSVENCLNGKYNESNKKQHKKRENTFTPRDHRLPPYGIQQSNNADNLKS